MNKFDKICFYPADILLPKGVEMEKWSVVACDQYTSQPEYWDAVRREVGDAPSTLKMILPEAELEQAAPAAARKEMERYLSEGLFETLPHSFIYLQRTQSDGKLREGLIGALDLECYDYRKGSSTLCRATEGTVEERLPPRIRVREGAPLELPHIMILIDDPEKTVIEPLMEQCQNKAPIYDFSLMQGGGHIKGYQITAENSDGIASALDALKGEGTHPLLYAVGDGNHSLATAKAIYAKLKERLGEDALCHPARYCLVELVNIHSPALTFEPIHRVVFDTDLSDLTAFLEKEGLEQGTKGEQEIKVVCKGQKTAYSFTKTTSALAVGTLQNALDSYLSAHAGRVDYIHGEDVVEQLTAKGDAVGFILPPMEKGMLFPAVAEDGALPRKTFSMGHAADKRFYLECRKIVKE